MKATNAEIMGRFQILVTLPGSADLSHVWSQESRRSKESVLPAKPAGQWPRVRVTLCFVSLAMSVLCEGVVSALAQDNQNLANFGQIASAQPTPTERVSLATVAPGLLPYFNNGPVFGLGGTVEGDFWHRTQLSGNWNGVRKDWADHGIFLDIYSTSIYQNVTSGGLKTGSAFAQNTQLSLNIDTAHAGLWSGGLFHFTVQSRYGSSPEDTFTVGSFVPQYTGFVEPGALLSKDTWPSEYFLTQVLSKKSSVVLGVISDVFIPDETLFGNSYKYYFANFNLNKNPLTTNFYNTPAIAALGVWTPTKSVVIGGGVLDPFTRANTFEDAFHNGVNLYVTAVGSFALRGRPGQVSPSFNWSNQPHIDLDSPFGPLSRAQVPDAVGALLGGSKAGLPVNFEKGSSFTIANVSQYLALKETDDSKVPEKLQSGEPLRGIGVFGRLGYAPKATNTLTRDGSVALFARGLWDGRPYDSFGVGFYYNVVSSAFRDAVRELTAGTSVKNEKGIEVFYDLAITPAIRVIPGYQHVWDPLFAQVAADHRWANLFLLRFTVAL